MIIDRGVAQLGRALRSGRRGRWFKSSRPDHEIGPWCNGSTEDSGSFSRGSSPCGPANFYAMFYPDPKLSSFLAHLPKTETHLHIEGALPWEFIRQLDNEPDLPEPEYWHPDFRFRDFGHFESDLLAMATRWYRSTDHYYEAARRIFQKLYDEENVRYIETSFASGCVEFLNLDGAAVAEAIQRAAPPGLTVKVFMGIHHDGLTARSHDFIHQSVDWAHLDGVDLHGVETTPLEAWTAPLWQRFRDAGKATKAHAGEFCGPDFIWQVLDELKVNRIEHGVRSIEDSRLVEHLAANDIVLDTCPISNLKLGVIPSIKANPIRSFVQAGVRCTVSTDDPLMFGNTLSDEYRLLYQHHGFSFQELKQIAANGFMIADMPETDKQRWLQKIEDLDSGCY